jgi:hypothetical protein
MTVMLMVMTVMLMVMSGNLGMGLVVGWELVSLVA